MYNVIFDDKKITPISEKEMDDLFIKKEHGDMSARNRLIECNVKLVLAMAKKINYNENMRDDYISAGVEGLVKAVDSFNSKKGSKFVTYAAICIRNEMLMQSRKERTYNNFTTSFEATVASNELGENKTIEDTLPSDTCVEREYEEKESKDEVLEALNTLSERDATIIRLFFGLNDEHRCYEQKELADMFGYSQSYMSRIIKAALIILKRQLKDKEIDVNYKKR